MSENGISIDSRKISSVVDWPITTTGRQIEKYLGLINYFRDFIPIYSTIAAPLECLRKHTSLPVEKWSQHQLDSFNLLKNILTQAPFLSFPNFRKPFIIATDASDAGIGAVLYQLKDPCLPDTVQNRKWVMFSARALNSSERNYSATKRELLAIVFALGKFHYYIWGSHFDLFTDHRALTFIFSQKNLNPMIINWLEILLSYSSIHHRPVPTDFAEPPSDVVPESERQREIELSHLKGHFGVKATLLDLIKQGKFWPSMRTDIESQLKSCPACRRWTITKMGYHPLTPITSEHLMDVIAMDTAKSFPTSPRGNNVLLVVIYNGTEFVNAIVHHLTTSFHIDHRLSTPYHPRANGLAERSVQTLCRAICKLLEGENQGWDLYFSVVQLFMNNKVSEFHSSSPFSIMFGRKLNPFCDYQTDADFVTPDANALKERMVEMSSVLFPAIGNLSKRSVNKAQLAFIKSLVLRRTKGGSYEILDSDNTLFPRNVAPSMMKLIQRNTIDDQDTYVVDKILKHKGPATKRSYFVKWKHYDSSYNSWVKASDFIDPSVINSYWSSVSPSNLGGETSSDHCSHLLVIRPSRQPLLRRLRFGPQTPSFSISTMEIIPKESLPVKTATEKEPAAPAVDPPSDMAAEITPAIQDDGVAPTVTPIADVEMCL
ncbi:hypothetical protein BASA83_006541 [Batrachochytrium salamandrivorans]|nr:hypothetical protein BASA83_006541 [Batrachochytrium salamandrivorans]